MAEGNKKLGGRWLAPGESPFKENPQTAQLRKQLTSSTRQRNEELTKLMNSRAPKRFSS